jgi:hypothetical protein
MNILAFILQLLFSMSIWNIRGGKQNILPDWAQDVRGHTIGVLPVHCQDTLTQQFHSETGKREKYSHGCKDAVPNKKRVNDEIPAGGLVKFLSRELDAPHVENKVYSPGKTELVSPQHIQNFCRVTYTLRSWKTRIQIVQSKKPRNSSNS